MVFLELLRGVWPAASGTRGVDSGLGGEEPASCQLDLMENIGPKQQVFGGSEALVGRGVGWAMMAATRP